MRGIGGRRIVLPWIAGFVVVVASVTVAVLLVPGGQQEPPGESVVLARPLPGEVRADYLPDGTPVWVAGHDNGDASVISAFSSHVPYGLGKLIWWCDKADAFDDPAHGGKWDEYGVRLGGPAPIGLATYETTLVGGRVAIGAVREGQPVDTPFVGPGETEREWCLDLDGGAAWHTFDGWRIWDSPAAAIAAEPDEWILLEGHLVAVGGELRLCAATGCGDSARVLDVAIPSHPELELGPFPRERFIAHVRDGAFADLARAIPLPGQ